MGIIGPYVPTNQQQPSEQHSVANQVNEVAMATNYQDRNQTIVRVISSGLASGKTDPFDQLAWYLRYGLNSVPDEEKHMAVLKVKAAFMLFFGECGAPYQQFSDPLRLEIALASRV